MLVAPLLFMVLVVGGVALVMSACGGGGVGGGEEQAKARPLPEGEKALRPGEYRTEEFKPSLSFRVGEGWSTSSEASDELEIGLREIGGIGFANVQKVYQPTNTDTPKVVEAPEDLVGWFEHHPYLQTDELEPVTVGGVKGQQFDVVVEDLPEDYLSPCGTDCVDVFRQTTGDLILFEGDKVHLIILEDVKDETVTIDYGSLATDFDEVAPEAQKVVDSVKWTGS